MGNANHGNKVIHLTWNGTQSNRDIRVIKLCKVWLYSPQTVAIRVWYCCSDHPPYSFDGRIDEMKVICLTATCFAVSVENESSTTEALIAALFVYAALLATSTVCRQAFVHLCNTIKRKSNVCLMQLSPINNEHVAHIRNSIMSSSRTYSNVIKSVIISM